MKKFTIYLLPFFFFLFQTSYSQSNFYPGYIVSLEGDTTFGFIKKQSGSKNCKQVVFKENDSQDRNIYEAIDLKSYFINAGQLYISGEIIYRNINIEADRIIDESKDNLSEEKAEYITATVFLNVLFLGEASLYSYVDEKSHPHFFIKKKDDEMYELYQLRKYGKLNYGGYQKDAYRIEKNYIGTLRNLFRECPEIMAKIDNTELNSKDLIKITKAFNKCVSPQEEESKDYVSPGGVRLEKSITIGGNFSEYHFSSSSSYFNFLTKVDQPKSFHFNLGFNLNLYDPNLSNKFSLRTGLTYFMIKYEYRHIDRLSSSLSDTLDVHLENHYLKFPVLISYEFSSTSLRPYIFIGTHCNFVLKSANYVISSKDSGTGGTAGKRGAFDLPNLSVYKSPTKNTRNFELLGFTVGGGIKHLKGKKFGYFMDIKYDRIPSISKIFQSTSESFFMTLGFIF